jgi:predicted metal-binding membrane protein
VALLRALRTGALPWLLGLAAAGFAACLALPQPLQLSALCGSLTWAPWRLDLLLGPQWSPAGVTAAWLIMLVAMMPPLLAQPVTHVWRASLLARRARALTLFAAAYTTVWLTAAAVLVPMAMVLRLAADDGASLAAVAVAVAWSCSPSAQLWRNRCHRRQAISALGWPADRDCLTQGASTGLACVGVCWPWMLVPMTFDTGHVVAMVAASFVLFMERLAPPAAAHWQMPAFAAVLWALRPDQKVLGRS